MADGHQIKSRMQDAKVYAVLFREDNTDRLVLMTFLAYSLDDVYEAMKRQMPPHEQWLPYMWHSCLVQDLVRSSTHTVDVEKMPTPKEIKDALMKRIIENKDETLFKMNHLMFTANEKKYIKDKIKKDGDVKKDNKI